MSTPNAPRLALLSALLSCFAAGATPAPKPRPEDGCDIPRLLRDCQLIQRQLQLEAQKVRPRPDQMAVSSLALQCIRAAQQAAQEKVAEKAIEARVRTRKLHHDANEAYAKAEQVDAPSLRRPTPRPPDHRVEVRGFGRYLGTSAAEFGQLANAEKLKVAEVADEISRSFDFGGFPIRHLRMIGHADVDRAKGKAFEQQISEQRARVLKQVLLERLARLTIPLVVRQVQVDTSGVGATQPAPENARKNADRLGETERKLNRRVEIFVEHSAAQVPPPLERPLGIDFISAARAAGREEANLWSAEVRCVERSHFPPGQVLRGDKLRAFLKDLECRFKNIDMETVFGMIHDRIAPPDVPDFMSAWDDIETKRRRRQQAGGGADDDC